MLNFLTMYRIIYKYVYTKISNEYKCNVTLFQHGYMMPI